MTTATRSRPPARKRRNFGYRGSGTLAMCGPGPHPGGQLFKRLCSLADSFAACKGDPAAAQIGSVLSLLAVYATKPTDGDFRYPLGSFMMDLAVDDEARARSALGPPVHVPYARHLMSR